MGLQHRAMALHGVQFHPEAILSQQGKQLLANFLHCANWHHAVVDCVYKAPQYDAVYGNKLMELTERDNFFDASHW